jgi:hypothetical protein
LWFVVSNVSNDPSPHQNRPSLFGCSPLTHRNEGVRHRVPATRALLKIKPLDVRMTEYFLFVDWRD